jgi:hypothetical protein
LEAAFADKPGIGGSRGIDIIYQRASQPTAKPGKHAPLLKNPARAKANLKNKIKDLVRAEQNRQQAYKDIDALTPENKNLILEKVKNFVVKRLKEAGDSEDAPLFYQYIVELAGDVQAAISMAEKIADEQKEVVPNKAQPSKEDVEELEDGEAEEDSDTEKSLREEEEIRDIRRLAGI